MSLSRADLYWYEHLRLNNIYFGSYYFSRFKVLTIFQGCCNCKWVQIVVGWTNLVNFDQNWPCNDFCLAWVHANVQGWGKLDVNWHDYSYSLLRVISVGANVTKIVSADQIVGREGRKLCHCWNAKFEPTSTHLLDFIQIVRLAISLKGEYCNFCY